MFKLDGNNIFNKVVIEITVYLNSQLGSRTIPTKPFCFNMPLNFTTEENTQAF